MKQTVLAALIAAIFGLTVVAVPAHAAAGDSITFKMVRSSGATCIDDDAFGRVTISDLGSVQNLHLEVTELAPNTPYTMFIIQHATSPFGLGWYQGDFDTDKNGRGVLDVTGILNDETFIVADPPVQMDHIGVWFADPADAVKAGCANTVTPFDGDHEAGIQVLNTSNFPDAKGPLLKLK